jgi:hypothetical protein
MTVSLDPRTNTAHIAPEADGIEHDLAGGWCPCRPVVLEVLAAPGGASIGFVVAHHADGHAVDAAHARAALIAGLPGHLRAVVA